MKATRKRSCWAACLGDCRGKITGEHLISACLFDTPVVKVKGSVWGQDDWRRIGLQSLTANILCEHHNSVFSPVDSEGGKLFRSIKQIDEETAIRERDLHGAWTPSCMELDGWLIERWFTKTTINLITALGVRLGTGQRIFPAAVPDYIVRAAFGFASLAPPRGLHNWAGLAVGEKIVIDDRIDFQSLTSTSEVLGAHFRFRGLNFLISFSGNAIRVGTAAENRVPLFRHFGGDFHVGRSPIQRLSHTLRFKW